MENVIPIWGARIAKHTYSTKRKQKTNMYHSFRLHHPLAAFRFFYQASQHMSVVAIVYNFPHYISPLRQFLNKTMKCDNNEKLDRSENHALQSDLTEL